MSNDIGELTALNRDYVASVQNCDVKRFDRILAQDFYCSNPDKSLVDRAAFLKQTAVPVTIKNLTAHDVKIRLLGVKAPFQYLLGRKMLRVRGQHLGSGIFAVGFECKVDVVCRLAISQRPILAILGTNEA